LRGGMNSNAEQKNRQSVVDFHRILQNANVLIDRKCTTALSLPRTPKSPRTARQQRSSWKEQRTPSALL
jgi:hypothetical protein